MIADDSKLHVVAFSPQQVIEARAFYCAERALVPSGVYKNVTLETRPMADMAHVSVFILTYA